MRGQRLFTGSNLIVDHIPFPKEACIITFSGYNGSRKSGFGQDFFIKYGIPAIHFVALQDHWWNVPETGAAVEAVVRSQSTLKYKRFVSYGSSMGAHGAARTSKALSVSAVIQAAPQYTIDPEKPPFEKRWEAAFRALNSEFDDIGGMISLSARKIIFVDLLSADKGHVDLMRGVPNTDVIHVPFSGHYPLKLLNEAGLLKGVVDDVLQERFLRAEFRLSLVSSRRRSKHFWNMVCGQAGRRGMTPLALCAIEEAVRIDPDSESFSRQRANALMRVGRLEEALAEIRRATTLDSASVKAWQLRATIAKRVGLQDEAAESEQRTLAAGR